MRRAYVVGLLLLSLSLFHCRREVGFIGHPDNPDALPLPDPITAVIQGNVLNETGQPAAGVRVEAGNKTATTDSKGYFRITGAELDKKAAVVTATKTGYFKAYRTFGATSGANQVLIKLIKKNITGSVSAASGGEVVMANGSKITLPANSVVTASGNNAYTGTVNVYASYIDPTSSDIQQIIPGSLLAVNKQGKRVLLDSYGMIAVELESTNGEKLQIKSGAKARLTTAIPAAVQTSAPATILLWSVDETTGVWKEEGTATKSGAVYVGEVSHFSFWNCDVAQNAVTLSLTLKNNKNIPLVNVEVRITRTAQKGVSFASGFTDSLGQVSGYVPANEPLLLEVMDECGLPFYTQNLTAVAKAADLGVITLSNTGSALVTVSGKLVNCTNAAVTDGFAIITFGYKVRYAAVNDSGEFQTTFTRCSGSPSTFTVVAIDNTTQQQNFDTTVAVSVPETVTGNIRACGTSSEEFIDYSVGSERHIISGAVATHKLYGFTDDSAQTSTKRTYLWGAAYDGTTNNVVLDFVHRGLMPGTYAITEYVRLGSYYANPPFTNLAVEVVITNFPQAVGQFYEGKITGSYKLGSGSPQPVSGTFRLRRIR